MNLVCIGSGYVGTATAAAFAAIGHLTTVVEIDQRKIDTLNSRRSFIFEPGLEQLLQQLPSTILHAQSSYQAVFNADIVMICVGTPPLSTGMADLSDVNQAAASIALHLNPDRFTVIVVKSTVPVGTAQHIAAIIENNSSSISGEQFAVVSNPEFLREGHAIEDVFFPDRIIIGANNEQARKQMRILYHSILERISYSSILKTLPLLSQLDTPKPIYFETENSSAEMIKYGSNAFLALKISYINEIARLCEALGADVLEVSKGIGLDPRVGDRFLQASPGWGGSCLPKDTAQLLAMSQQYGCEVTTIQAAIAANHTMQLYCVEKLQHRLKALNGKHIGVLGLTFKPNTDDVRQAQSAVIIKKLLELNSTVSVHDPKGMESFQRLHGDLPLTYCETAEQTAVKAHAIILLTHWEEYQNLNWDSMYQLMVHPYVLDTRNVLDPSKLLALGFHYEGIGRQHA